MPNRKPLFYDPASEGFEQINTQTDTISASGYIFKDSANFITLDNSDNIIFKDQSGDKSLAQLSSIDSGTSVNFIEGGNQESLEITDYSTGQSLIFNDSGSPGGVFEMDTTSPLRGVKSLKFTNHVIAASSDNDWISKLETIPNSYGGLEFEFRLKYTNQFQSGNIKAKLIDDTGRTLIEEDLLNSEDSQGQSSEFSRKILIHKGTSNITWGIQVVNGESSKEFFIDDVSLSSDIRQTQETVFLESDDSMVRLNTGNGFASGASFLAIRRFSNFVESQGSAVTYADSVTEGASFTIEEDGVFHISYSEANTVGNTDTFCITLNSSDNLTTPPNLPADTKLAIAEIGEDKSRNGTISWSGLLSKGDVIRAHTEGTLDSSSSDVQFTITKIGGVKGFTALKDQKVEIANSEIIMRDSTTRGTGAELFTIQYNNLESIIGSSLAVNNSNGTVITVLEE
jgi:hypothetical protein